jgi:hypothetical protein
MLWEGNIEQLKKIQGVCKVVKVEYQLKMLKV